jgi:hypothetical protein
MRALCIWRQFALTTLVAVSLCTACSGAPKPINDDPPITYPLAIKDADPLELLLIGEESGAISYQVDCIGVGTDLAVTVGAGDSLSGQIVERRTFAPAGCPGSGTIIGDGTLAYPLSQQGQSFVTMTITPNPTTLQTPTPGRVLMVTIPLVLESDGHLHSGPIIDGP